VYINEGTVVKRDQIIGKAGNLSRYNRYGILFSLQYRGKSLKYDEDRKRFMKNHSGQSHEKLSKNNFF
jgi:hypothetical protein